MENGCKQTEMKAELTKQEKTIRAKKLRDFFATIAADGISDHNLSWENIWQRALWILTD